LARKITVTDISVSSGNKKSDSPSGKIEKKVWIRASAEIVYKALTESKELVRWFCDRASCKPHEGGELVVQWNTGKLSKKGRAVFTRIEPNALLEMAWIDDGCGVQTGNPNHTLSYSIRTKSSMTEVIMVDRDSLISDKEVFDFLDQGWNGVLMELKDYCERRERSAKLSAKNDARD
jgi:uncharacterized protein YndB with AHSA1/START domain